MPRRLKTRAQFQTLLAGPPVARTAHFALHRLDWPVVATSAAPAAALFVPPGGVWLGAMVPKRWARRAVTRNAIRRQIHALGAGGGEGSVTLAPGVHLVRLRAAFATSAFPSASSVALKRAVRGELLRLFARATGPRPS